MFSQLLIIYKKIIQIDKSYFFTVQLVSIISAILELISIFVLSLYINFLTSPEKIINHKLFNKSLNFIYNNENFLLYFSFLVITIFLLSSIFSIITIWQINNFSLRLGYNIGGKIFSGYINDNFNKIKLTSRDKIFTNINDESKRVGGLANSLLQIILSLVLSIILIIPMFAVNTKLIVFGIIFFVSVYYLIFKRINSLVYVYGEKISKFNSLRVKFIFQGIENIREIMVYNLQKSILSMFNQTNENLVNVHVVQKMFAQSTRFVFNFLIVLFFVISILFLLNTSAESNFKDFLPELVFLGLTTLKLLPSFQTIYSNLINIKSNLPAYNNIKNDIDKYIIYKKNDIISKHSISFEKKIELKNVSFSYRSKNKNIKIISHSNFSLEVGDFVWISGPSGGGKTTLLEILLNLLKVESASYLVDGKKIARNYNISNLFAYVPQKVYIKTGSIQNNITLYTQPKSNTEKKRFNKIIKILKIDNFLKKDNRTINFNPGDMGEKLSGGQKQRIGIARALYMNKKILVLDESTNAIDKGLETKILKNLKKIYKDKIVVIVSHNKYVGKLCNKHYLIKNKKVINIKK